MSSVYYLILELPALIYNNINYFKTQLCYCFSDLKD